MSSYAEVASHAPSGPNPQPDPSLLEGHNQTSSQINQHPDVNSSKVNTVPAGSNLEDLDTETHSNDEEKKEQLEKKKAELKKEAEKKGKTVVQKIRSTASSASEQTSQSVSHFLSTPKYWLSSLGLVNSLLIGGLGIFAYTRREEIRRADRRVLGAIAVGAVGIFGGQSFFAADAARKQTSSDKKPKK